MPKTEIQEHIHSLRHEVAQLNDEQAPIKTSIDKIISTMEAQIDNLEDEQTHSNLLADIRDTIDTFEIEHPQITDFLSRINALLSSMGI